MRVVRWWFWVEAAAAAIGFVTCVATLAARNWIEALFKVDPDHGSGALEWGIVAGALLVAVVATTLARREWSLARASA